MVPMDVPALATLDLGDVILQAAFQPARFGLARQVLPLAVLDPTHRRVAGIAAVARRDARRLTRRLVTAGTVAENSGKIPAAA